MGLHLVLGVVLQEQNRGNEAELRGNPQGVGFYLGEMEGRAAELGESLPGHPCFHRMESRQAKSGLKDPPKAQKAGSGAGKQRELPVTQKAGSQGYTSGRNFTVQKSRQLSRSPESHQGSDPRAC